MKWSGWTLICLAIFIGGTNIFIVNNNKDKVKEEISKLKEARVALVLGTSKSTQYGTNNLFFTDRMKATAKLYHAGKVKHIIVSGDNRTKYYNEPQDMLEALQKLGVPSDVVTLDYAGLRTLDSVVRCKEIFDQDDIIIVTQRFHAFRAVFIARRYDIRAQAYSADFDSQVFGELLVREVIARSLAFIDIYFLNRSPKYLGKKEILDITE